MQCEVVMRSPRVKWMRWGLAGWVAIAGAGCSHDSLDPSGEAVATVEIAPSPAIVAVGASVLLTATALDAGGNALAGRKVQWVSADSNFATVSGAGVVTGKFVGTVPIAASIEGKSATADVVVIPMPVALVRVSPASRDLTVGQSAQLTAQAFDARGIVLPGRAVTWSSSAPNVVTVTSSGLVTALSPGNATITASIEGRTGTSSVKAELPPVARVEVLPTDISVRPGQTAQLTARVYDARNTIITGYVVTWTSSDTKVATVDNTGRVRGERQGTATITATAGGKSGSARVRVQN